MKKDQDNDSINDYDYDKAGNVTLDAENKRFVYDAENHQTALFNSNNNSQTPDAVYSYDGEGKRVKKISSTETTVFVYDGGGQLVAEYSTQISQTPQVSYLTADHLGSPRVITDAVGSVIARKDFGAFGDETYTAQRTTAIGYKPENIRQDYTGYEKDNESGLEYAQARYYNSSHGRFTSVDPLTASANVKDPQTFNRYSYAMNSPYKFTDPLGLVAASPGNNGERTSNGCGADSSRCSDDYTSSLPMQTRHHDTGGAAPSGNCSSGECDSSGAAGEPGEGQSQDQAQQSANNPFDGQIDNVELKKIDSDLTGIFTDTGIVRGASSKRDRHPKTGDNHYQFGDEGENKLHTIHIYANENADSSNAGVYIPTGFSRLVISSKGTVIATNPQTGEVIVIAHVQVGSMKMLLKNTKTVRKNGTMYIGQIGGDRGTGDPTTGRGIHAHLTYYVNEKARSEVARLKGDLDPTSSMSKYMHDFRSFIK